jgi:hypothetical protein
MNMLNLAEEALRAYDTNDLSIVAASFSSCVDSLWKIAEVEGWAELDVINRHPVCILFSDRITQLVSCETSLAGSEYYRAYNWARDIITWGRVE